MKKQRIFTLTAMGLVALLLVGGIVVAVADDNSAIIPFEATRVRTGQIVGTQQFVGCNIKRAEQIAFWTVTSEDPLVA